jgi:hypothetical protein
MALKTCSHCEEELPLDSFKKNKDGKLGRHSICKICCSNRDKMRYANGDTYAVRLKKLYGLSVSEYEEMYNEAGGCCQVCGVKESELNRRLAVDHCHSTGKVRGLLCGKCNTALGQLDDDLNRISSLYSYLKERS